MEDSLWAGLTDSHAGMPMGMTAENLADKVILLYLAIRYSTVRYGTLLVFAPEWNKGGRGLLGGTLLAVLKYLQPLILAASTK